MNCLPDAFRTRQLLRGSKSSIVGVVALVILAGLLIWLYLS